MDCEKEMINCLENIVTSGSYFDLDIAKFLLKYIFKDSKYENQEVIKYLLEDFVVLMQKILKNYTTMVDENNNNNSHTYIKRIASIILYVRNKDVHDNILYLMSVYS